MFIVPSRCSTRAPSTRSRCAIVCVSCRCGTRDRTLVPSERSAAVITGRTAFLAPLAATLPSSRTGPSMTTLSTPPPLLAAEPDAIVPGVVLQHRDVAQPGVPEERLRRGAVSGADLDRQRPAGGQEAYAPGAQVAVEVETVGAAVQRRVRLVLVHEPRQRFHL